MDFAQILSKVFLSHVYFYFGENVNLRVRVEIVFFPAEINAYFAVKFRYKNQFVSAQKPPNSSSIDRMHKWRPKKYSFVYVLISLTSLVCMDKLQ